MSFQWPGCDEKCHENGCESPVQIEAQDDLAIIIPMRRVGDAVQSGWFRLTWILATALIFSHSGIYDWSPGQARRTCGYCPRDLDMVWKEGRRSMLVETTAASILSPVAGCLAEWSANAGVRGITHTLNPFVGCPIGKGQCGTACYARHLQSWARMGHKPEDWGQAVYLKTNAAELYVKEIRTASKKKAVGIFMSSVTEPMPPQQKARQITRRLLEAMVASPPGLGLIIQSHTSYAASPEILDVIERLSQKTSVLVSISIETNRPHIRGLRPPCSSIENRLDAFRVLSSRGIATQASISPLMPCDPKKFARLLRQNGCWRVILDHWEIGDGSCGRRTESVGVPEILRRNGYDPKWCSAEVLDELQPVFEAQGFPGGVGRKENFFAYIPEPSRFHEHIDSRN